VITALSLGHPMLAIRALLVFLTLHKFKELLVQVTDILLLPVVFTRNVLMSIRLTVKTEIKLAKRALKVFISSKREDIIAADLRAPGVLIIFFLDKLFKCILLIFLKQRLVLNTI